MSAWTLYCQRLESLGYLRLNNVGLSLLKFLWWNGVRNGRSRSSKSLILAPIESAYRVCDFLFVINSNLVPILSLFRDIAGFLLKTAPHLYSTRILVVFPLDYRVGQKTGPLCSSEILLRSARYESLFQMTLGSSVIKRHELLPSVIWNNDSYSPDGATVVHN